jgi:hypothetical protein
VIAPVVDLSFPHQWQAEILLARPAILPARRFVYPREAEEIERGALEVLVRPACEAGHDLGCVGLAINEDSGAISSPENPAQTTHESGQDFSRADTGHEEMGALAPEANISSSISSQQPFLATCAVGFLDPIVPTGIWSCPNPREICAVSGGYAYIIDTTAPERFTMIPFRPVLEVRSAIDSGLLLFVGHYSIIAWCKNGQAWQSEKLSDEGVTIAGIESGVLRGLGWKMMTDKETAFAINMQTGARISSGR